MMSFIATRGKDQILVTVLEDGTVKTQTSKVSMANHTSAENFLNSVQSLLGGQTVQEFKPPVAINEQHGHDHHHQ